MSGPEKRDLARALARLAAKAMKDKVGGGYGRLYVLPNPLMLCTKRMCTRVQRLDLRLCKTPQPAAVPQVPNVFHSSVGLLQALVEAMAGGGRDVASAVEQALPVLTERLGDSNARLRDGARDALLALAQNRESGLRYSGGNSALLRPVKSQTAWRPVLSTLQLMQVRRRQSRRGSCARPCWF